MRELNEALRKLCCSGRLAEAVDWLCRQSSPSSSSSVRPETYALLLQESIHHKQSKLGRRVHAHMIAVRFQPDEYLLTKLLIFYAKDKDLQAARYLFDRIPHTSLVSWNGMISGYVLMGKEAEQQQALHLYHLMRSFGLQPDQFTFSSVYRACAGLAVIEQGRRAHAVMIKTLSNSNIVVNSALMDMYLKCSSLSDGHKVFCYSQERNVVSWTALLSGYGQHGQVVKVLEFFHQMVEDGFRPNHVTFLVLLSACSHGGLIDEGWTYFSSMIQDYGIIPKGEHYAAIVDMLGRAGRLNDAYEFAKKSPCNQHSVIWGTLLGSCRTYGHAKLVKIASEKFFQLQPKNAGKYIVLSNTYAAFEMWQNVADIRGRINTLGINKEPAWSSVEVRGDIHTFLAGDNSHKESKMVYQILHALSCALLEESYLSL